MIRYNKSKCILLMGYDNITVHLVTEFVMQKYLEVIQKLTDSKVKTRNCSDTANIIPLQLLARSEV